MGPCEKRIYIQPPDITNVLFPYCPSYYIDPPIPLDDWPGFECFSDRNVATKLIETVLVVRDVKRRYEHLRCFRPSPTPTAFEFA